jgi:hypothetical protein
MAESASFEVCEVFRFSTGPSVVFAGRVLDGEVRTGMEIVIELQPRLTCTCTIGGIEYIDRPSTGESLVGLVCSETGPGEAGFYAELCPPGTVVVVNG